MSYVPTKSSDNTNPLVYAEETTTYGTPELNAAYKHVGIATEWSWSRNKDVEDLYMVSLEYPYGSYAFGTEYEFTVSYAMVNTNLYRYGTVLPAGSGTIAKGLTFVQSKMIDGAEMFRVFTGCITESVELPYERILIAEQTFIPKSVTHWLTEAEKDTMLGATANLSPAALTEDPYTAKSAGTLDPFTVDGDVIDIGELTISCEWQILTWMPQNHEEPKFISAQRREVSGELTTTVKDNMIEDLVISQDGVPGILQVSNAPGDDVDLTFGDMRFNNYEAEDVADSDEFDVYSVEFKATTYTVSTVTV
jgi:hypothetical protein